MADDIDPMTGEAEGTVEPAPAEGGSYSSPPVYDRMAQARAAGYSWQDIDGHLADRRAAAVAAGYDDSDVDQFLGYNLSQAAADRFTANWTASLAANPEQAKGAAQPTSPDQPSPVSLDHPDMMADYARALLAGDVKGPQDFADKYGQSYIAALDQSNPEVEAIQRSAFADQIAANIKRASDDLAAQLPDIKELTDTSLALAAAAAGDPTAAQVGAVRENLMQRWAETGERPMQLYQRALQDPVLGAQLTTPTVTPPVVDAATAALDRVAEAAKAGLVEPWEDLPDTLSDIKRSFENAPVAGKIMTGLGSLIAAPVELSGRVLGSATLPIVAGAFQLISEVFDRQAQTPEESAKMAAHFMNEVLVPFGVEEGIAGAGRPVPRVNFVDPLKEPGAAVRTAPASELVPKAAEVPAPSPEATPEPIGKRLAAAKASPAESLEAITKEANAPASIEQAATEAGADLATQELARGYDIASAIYATFHNIMTDTSGRLNLFRTPQQAMERAKYIAARDYVQPLIREKMGLANQVIQAQFAKLEPYMAAVNKYLPEYERQIRLGPAARLNGNPIHEMLKYIEGRSTGYYLDPNSPLKPVADIVREVYQSVRQQIEATLPNMNSFYEDYYRHLWQNPAKADQVFGIGKQGSGASLRKRVLPTLADGIARGLMPKFLNPIENTLHYVQGMMRHLAARQILDTAHGAGFIEYHPKAPIGMVPLRGLAAEKPVAPGVMQRAYASPGFATSYNNWLSRGFYDSQRFGKLYDRLLYAANAMTGLKLIVPTYHALAMASETSIASLANGFGEIMRGELLRGLKDIGAGVTVLPSLIETAAKGRRVQQNYLRMAGDPVSTLFAEANGRAVGRQEIYKMGSTPSLITSIRRRSLGMELRADTRHIIGSPDEAPGVRAAMFAPRLVGFAGREIGRVLNTISAPLFDHLIPWLKQGAFGAEMEAWLRRNPTATAEDARAYARNLVDSMDNRFGELNQDNLFWNAYAKQLANLLLVSTGWEYGSLRAFGNAVGWDVDRMRPAWNPVAFRWMLGFVVGASLQNALYQYARTGALPWQTNSMWTDLIAPRTGGKSPEGAPERAVLPGYQKDVFNLVKAWMFARDPFSAAQNLIGILGHKANPFWQTAWTALVTGKDAIGHDIASMPVNGHAPHGFLDRMHNYLTHVFLPAFEPIAVENQGERLKGTGLTPLEGFLGIRPAPPWIIDPTRYAKIQEMLEKRAQQQELNRARHENKRLETPDTSIPPAQPRAARQVKRDYFGMPERRRTKPAVKRDYFGMPIAPQHHQR